MCCNENSRFPRDEIALKPMISLAGILSGNPKCRLNKPINKYTLALKSQ
jgi:hypothetical protein